MSSASRRRDTRHGQPARPLRLVAPESAVLRRVAETVNPSDELAQLAMRLQATARRAHGAAVAAPQIGEPLRLVATAAGLLVANPQIHETAGEQTGPEGCLTFPGRWWLVTRPARLTLAGYDPQTGDILERRLEGFDARLWCHEIDHLDGLMLDASNWPGATP